MYLVSGRVRWRGEGGKGHDPILVGYGAQPLPLTGWMVAMVTEQPCFRIELIL